MDTNVRTGQDLPPTCGYTSQPAHALSEFSPSLGHSCGQSGCVHPRKEKRAFLFWGISGGTALSVVGFIAMLLFEQYNDSLSELRNDLKRFHMSCADLVKKEELRNRMNHIRTGFKEMQAANVAGAAREARIAQTEQQFKSLDEERRELTRELQRLRERLASVEGRLAATSPAEPARQEHAPPAPANRPTGGGSVLAELLRALGQ